LGGSAEKIVARVEMTANASRIPPGPKGLPIVGVSFELLGDALSLLRRVAREYGDIVRIPVAFGERILLNHPDWIEQLLVIQHSNFIKARLARK
jgi:hypothetical protein